MELTLWVLVRGVAVGAVFGVIPLVVGATRSQFRLGLKGLLACLVGAVLLGALLAMPAAAAFVWLVLRADRRATAPRQAAAQNRRRHIIDMESYPLPIEQERRSA